MRLNDIVASAFDGAFTKLNGATARLRRNAILYSLCAFCAVAAVVFAASASVLALEPHVGVVYARLILAGAFAFMVLGIVFALWLSSQPAPPQPRRCRFTRRRRRHNARRNSRSSP